MTDENETLLTHIDRQKKKTKSRDLVDSLRKFALQNLIEEAQYCTEKK